MNHAPDTRQATALDEFREWREAVDAAARLRRTMVGRRIRYAGMNGAGENTGKIVDVTASGFKVKFDYGTVGMTHPDDLVFL